MRSSNFRPVVEICLRKRVKSTLCRLPILLNHVRPFFANHDAWGHGVATHDTGHDGAIDHPNALHAVDAQARVHHGIRRIGPHATTANRMVVGTATVADELLPVRIGLAMRDKQVALDACLEGRCIHDRCRGLDAFDERGQIIRMR